MRISRSTAARGAAVREWGSNVDVGDFAALDAELDGRVGVMDELLEQARAVMGEFDDPAPGTLRHAKRRFTAKWGKLLRASEEPAAARKKAEAEAGTVDERIALDDAELCWELAKIAIRACDTQINATQTRAAMLRTQRGTEATAGKW